MRFTKEDLPVPVPPTMATNWPGFTSKLMWESTSSPVPVATYLKDTSRNSTSPLGAGRTCFSASGLSSTEGSVLKTSLIRWAQAWARESCSRDMATIITLMRIWTM